MQPGKPGQKTRAMHSITDIFLCRANGDVGRIVWKWNWPRNPMVDDSRIMGEKTTDRRPEPLHCRSWGGFIPLADFYASSPVMPVCPLTVSISLCQRGCCARCS